LHPEYFFNLSLGTDPYVNKQTKKFRCHEAICFIRGGCRKPSKVFSVIWIDDQAEFFVELAAKRGDRLFVFIYLSTGLHENGCSSFSNKKGRPIFA